MRYSVSRCQYCAHFEVSAHSEVFMRILKLRLRIWLKLYCPNDFSPVGNSGGFPRGKPAATESQYLAKPTAHAGCFSVSIIHRTLTRTRGSLTCVCDLLVACSPHAGRRFTSQPGRKYSSRLLDRPDRCTPPGPCQSDPRRFELSHYIGGGFFLACAD